MNYVSLTDASFKQPTDKQKSTMKGLTDKPMPKQYWYIGISGYLILSTLLILDIFVALTFSELSWILLVAFPFLWRIAMVYTIVETLVISILTLIHKRMNVGVKCVPVTCENVQHSFDTNNIDTYLFTQDDGVSIHCTRVDFAFVHDDIIPGEHYLIIHDTNLDNYSVCVNSNWNT